MQMKLQLLIATAVMTLATANPSFGQILFQENFDSLLPTLQGSVNERVATVIDTVEATEPGSTAIADVYSPTAPGWTVDRNLSTYDGSPTITPGVAGTGVAGYGVDEWDGWNFVNKDFWTVAAGEQDREMFGMATGAAGTVAVADPDEYFDLGGPDDETNGGYYSSSMTSPMFNVTPGEFYAVGFDSSWRDEAFDDDAPGGFDNANNQAVEVIFNFDVGGSTQVVKWNSDSADAFFKDDAPDENFAADGVDAKLTNPFVQAPAGATQASVTFSLANAGNDWWWAVDNILVNELDAGGNTEVYSEDFESVDLGDSVNERLVAAGKLTIDSDGKSEILGQEFDTFSRDDSFTHTPPADFTVDNTGTPNVGDEASDDVGVFEFEQWAFVTPEFWTFVDGQGRGDFAKGTGVFAVADGDEWDDLGDPGSNGDLTTFFQTPDIDVSGLSEDEILRLVFDSSWRAEDDQTAKITVVLDGVEQTEALLEWVSDSASELFHDDNTNETVGINFDPQGASTISLKFSYVGNDDWWWAVDNISVSVIPEPSSALFVLTAIGGLGLRGRRRR